MRYLTTALISEGKTDDRFLLPLLGRALADMCAAEFDEVVDVADVRALRAHGGPPSIDDIMGLVEAERGSFNLVFVHRDQGASPTRVLSEWLGPLTDRWGDRPERLVTVVPVREMEAWLLADGDAIRSALRVTWPDDQLGVPRAPDRVETIPDPKKVLDRLGTRMSRSFDAYYERLAEEISILTLRRVPAFDQWWVDTSAALVAAGFRRCR